MTTRTWIPTLSRQSATVPTRSSLGRRLGRGSYSTVDELRQGHEARQPHLIQQSQHTDWVNDKDEGRPLEHAVPCPPGLGQWQIPDTHSQAGHRRLAFWGLSLSVPCILGEYDCKGGRHGLVLSAGHADLLTRRPPSDNRLIHQHLCLHPGSVQDLSTLSCPTHLRHFVTAAAVVTSATEPPPQTSPPCGVAAATQGGGGERPHCFPVPKEAQDILGLMIAL